MKTYTLQGDIKGHLYIDLLKFSTKFCDKFILVVQHTLDSSENVVQALDLLSPFILSSSEKSEWPGTTLLAGTAMVNEYQFQEGSLDLLLKLSNGLYDWKQPLLPEDLALLRHDGSVFLGSTAHEMDAFVNLTSFEASLFRQTIPALKLEL